VRVESPGFSRGEEAKNLVSSGPRRFVPWDEVGRGARKLPSVDCARFRADIDAAVDQDFLIGDEQ
jgi:hypothetical protein